MKSKVCSVAILMSVFLSFSCGHTESGSFRTLSLNDKDAGITRKISICCPQEFAGDKAGIAVYMFDDELFNLELLAHDIDSLSYLKLIEPIVIANVSPFESMSWEFFTDKVIPAVNDNAGIEDADLNILVGKASGADLAIGFGMMQSGTVDECWCFSPTVTDVGRFESAGGGVPFTIGWNLREDDYHTYNQYPTLVNSIRKRGGSVTTAVYNDADDATARETEFIRLLIERAGVER